MLTTEVARRLELRLRLGQFPMVRRRLYARVQKVCIQCGEAALKVVADLLQECEGPRIRDAGQYFCFVIKRRLEENGFPWDGSSATSPATPPGLPPGGVRQLVQTLAGQTVDPVADPIPTTRREAEDDMRRKLEARRMEEVKARLLARAREQEAQP